MNTLRTLLLPLSWLYEIVIVLRNFFYDKGIFRTESVGIPVVSVGNLTVGGTGKTPIVEYIVRHYLENNVKVAVVSRGYKRRTTGTVVVCDGTSILSTLSESGDESFQIARKFPSAIVVVDERRVRGAQCAKERYGAEVIVLDDGFQHRSLHRSLDIVVMDVQQPPYETRMLPSGSRREPVSSLARAHVILLSRWYAGKGEHVGQEVQRRTTAAQFQVVFTPKVLIRISDGTRKSLDEMKGKSCLAFCGIARPETFEMMLKAIGFEVREFRTYPDHYKYSEEDLNDFAWRFSEQKFDIIVTTEKDAVRLFDDSAQRFRDQYPLYYVRLDTQISDSSRFSELLLRTTIRK